MNFKKTLYLFIFFIFFWLPQSLMAKTSFESFSFKPTLLESSYFSVVQSKTLKENYLYFSNHVEYQYKPLTITSRAGIKTNVITHMSSTHLSIGCGLSPQFSFSLGLPFVFWQKFTQVGRTERGDKFGLGDLKLAGQYQVLTINEKKRFGLALQPFVLLPSGFKDVYAGFGKPSGGVVVVTEYQISPQLFVALNTGTHIKSEYDVGNAHSSSDLMLNLGLSLKTSQNSNWFIEVQSRSPFDRFYKDSQAIVLMTHTGFGFKLSERFKMKTAVGSGFFNGIGTPLFRFIAGISADVSLKKKDPLEEKTLYPIMPLPITEEPKKPVRKKVHKRKRRFLPIR